MLQEIKGKRVIIYLNLSPWGDHRIKGEVIEVNDSWLKLKRKNTVEVVKIESIKRVTVLS